MPTIEQLATLIGALFTGGGVLTGIVAWSNNKTKEPIERETAQVANAAAISNTANSLLKTVYENMQKQDAKLQAQDEKIQEQDSKIQEQDRKILEQEGKLEILRAWDAWYDVLHQEWPTLKQEDYPPERPN